ncbi:heavy-metal-associated domain-containing protein [Paracoccus sp. M683]|uniref:heavy-metal-associated domain-containing protein n=1 Tax=Paracoccus sp. M683 TaxID=2594268 RepID=UPI00117FD071|nr:heavy-metal-associated domain-containing protein [Paracoccus sp. M683]TRW98385.1 heavy-metal-associated domain-containing protein [Paracoccus sp. M683]
MEYKVPDMSCGHCKASIEEAISTAGGTAKVDLENRRVSIDGLDPARAEAAIREAGFSPEPA